MPTALITGVTGQDGSYLADFLIEKGYKVWGLVRRSSSFNTGRIDHLIEHHWPGQFGWDRGDLSDESSITRVLRKVQPDEIYNLAAQSHVKVSFEIPVYSVDVDATGTLRLLEAIRHSESGAKLYHASSSEMFGSSSPPQNEQTPFRPRSPYAIAKLAAHQLCVNYREAYGLWIACGILFNHESPRRGETFVTRKITRGVSRIALGIQKELVLGNLQTQRDWGYAPEYVVMMWMMLQQKRPEDYVVATGHSHSVLEFVNEAFMNVGVELTWVGEGLKARAIVKGFTKTKPERLTKIKRGDTVVRVSEEYFRPTEPNELRGDSSKARANLGWVPRIGFKELVRIMVRADMKNTLLLLEGTRKHNQEWREFIV